MASLPAGTVTFLFTDIEGSTACFKNLVTAGSCRRAVELLLPGGGGLSNNSHAGPHSGVG